MQAMATRTSDLENTKTPDEDKVKMSCDMSATSGGCPFAPEDVVNIIAELFAVDRDTKIHNYFICSKNMCNTVTQCCKSVLGSKKFHHDRFITAKYWWLVFKEDQSAENCGMYCFICKKHQMANPQNKSEKFCSKPSIRFKYDALNTHATVGVHAAAMENELLQHMSPFHQENVQRKAVRNSVYNKAFSTAYFIMSNYIANRVFVPLIEFAETVLHVPDLRYFDHKSVASCREILILLGKTLKQKITDSVRCRDSFGLMTDEVTDISVSQQLVTFIQYFDKSKGCMQTKFLSSQDILVEYNSANANAIYSLLKKEIESNDLSVKSCKGLSTDGASGWQ
ncbi:uncharacterized protein [Ptychodera flava]|uniref:uncharacterized protein isoform X1 n=1 Tax=Ptychodera flava TaxID=63121 RepID=UPI003969BE7A